MLNRPFSVTALAAAVAVMSQQSCAEARSRKGVNPVVVMETSMGTLKIELWAKEAPATVENFLKYVDEGFFDGTIFHRVIDDFMIQGGGFTRDMQKKRTHAPIKNEAKAELKNDRGTLAMARTSDINSATAQFFINVVDNDFLNHKDETARGFGYCAFGRVVEGMDVVDRMRKVRTATKMGFQNVPVEPIEIKSATRAKAH